MRRRLTDGRAEPLRYEYLESARMWSVDVQTCHQNAARRVDSANGQTNRPSKLPAFVVHDGFSDCNFRDVQRVPEPRSTSN